MKKVIYIAGKYRGASHYEVLQNIETARNKFIELTAEGYAPICPHTMCAWLEGAISGEEETDDIVWLENDLAIVAKCDAIYMLDGWEYSKGATNEYAFAKELGLEIIFEKTVSI